MPWISSKHNMGFAFNRTTWQGIRKCARHFCTYDDYNWDWSLQHVSQQCLQRKLHAMIVKGPRVFHIGEWWVQVHGTRMWIPILIDFFSFCRTVEYITRTRTVSRIRWFPRCNMCFVSHVIRINSSPVPWWWPCLVCWRSPSCARATAAGATGGITSFAWTWRCQQDKVEKERSRERDKERTKK